MNIDKDTMRNILDNLYEGVYFVDNDITITYWNRGAERITGYREAEVLGKKCCENVLMHVSLEGVNLCATRSCLALQAIKDGRVFEEDVHFHHKNGHRVPVLTRIAPVRDAGGVIIGAVEVFNDKSSQIEAQQRIEDLQKMALLDDLTRVGNRRYAEMSLSARFEEMKRYGWAFGIMLIDIDMFKQINDRQGHMAGDRALKIVAETLTSNTRAFDTVARWGGDEFLVIVIYVSQEQLFSHAERLRKLVGASGTVIGSEDLRVTISVGAAMAQESDTAKELLERADGLLYKSKAAGRNRVTCLDAEKMDSPGNG